MRAAVYVRVSTDEQAKEGYSIESQKQRIIDFIRSQNWDIVDFYIDDGYSAKDLERPHMQRLIHDVKRGKINTVVFYKLDRLVRSVADLDKLLKLFEQHKVAIRSVTEIFDTTTAMGRFFITLVASMAQWERETISERVVENMTKKAMLGERNGGIAPFGYDLKNGDLVINEEEARYVREIYNMYLNGKGMRLIAVYLNQINIKTDLRQIGRILENPVYCGKIRWGNRSKKIETIITEATHPPIIDEETFEKVQTLRNQRKTEGKKATSPYPFSGILRCARCGGPLSGWFKKERGTKHYICINKKNKGTCDLPIFLERVLASSFLESISPADPANFFELVSNFEYEPKEKEDHTYRIKLIEKEISAIKTRKRNWLMALGNGTMSQSDYIDMTKEDAQKEELLKEQLKELLMEEVQVDKNTVLETLKSISDLWYIASDYEKKSFVNDLFERIVVDVPESYFRGRGKTPTIEIKEVSLR